MLLIQSRTLAEGNLEHFDHIRFLLGLMQRAGKKTADNLSTDLNMNLRLMVTTCNKVFAEDIYM